MAQYDAYDRDPKTGQRIVGSESNSTRYPGDNPVNPAHYQKAGGIETIDYIEAVCADLPGDEVPCVSNILKYTSRYRQKHPENPVRDLYKTRWYLDRLIKMVEEKMGKEGLKKLMKEPAPWAPGSEEAALFKTNTSRPGDVPGSRDRNRAIPTIRKCGECGAEAHGYEPLHHYMNCSEYMGHP
jgi:hypothetical protein